MISDEQLIAWEAELDNGRYQWHGEIRELIAEVRRYNLLQMQFAECQKQFADTCENLVQTRREADWLAKWQWPNCPAEQMIDDCEDGMSPENCIKCWREYARKEVSNDK